jgi:hypothetical protein
VIFDGVEITEEFLTRIDDETDVYTLPQVLSGSHDVQLEMEDFGTVDTRVSVYGDNDVESIQASNLALSEEQQQQVIDTAYADLTALIDAAVGGKSFKDVKNLFDADAQESAENNYSNFAERFCASGQEEGIKNIFLSDVIGSIETVSLESGSLVAYVELEYDYTVQGTRSKWFSDEIIEGTDEDNYGYNYLTLIYKDGAWVLDSTDMPYVTSYYISAY